MALLGGCNENRRIEENIQSELCFQNGFDPFLANLLKNAIPVCSRYCSSLMDPQTIDLDHGRPLLDPFEKHAVGVFNSLQLRFSGLKPSRSRRGLGTTIRPALSILSSIPSTMVDGNLHQEIA